MDVSKKILASVVFAVLGGAFFSTPVRAEADATEWVGQAPMFTKSKNISFEQFHSSESYNVPCTLATVRKKAVFDNGWDRWIVDSLRQGCLVPMTNAYADIGNGEMLYYGNRLNYMLGDDDKSFGMGKFYMMYPVANTSKIAFVKYDDNFLVMTKDYTQTFSRAEHDSYMNVFLMRTKKYDFTLKDSLGRLARVNAGTISFSKNGSWMTVSTFDEAWLRINLDTNDILPFAPPHPRGGYATAQTVSNDGRFVAVFNPFDGLYVYDLEKCEVEKGVLVSRNCQFRKIDVSEIDATLGSDTVFMSRLTFEGNSKLSAFISRVKDGQYYYEEYKISVPTQAQPVKYLALGDSFSSGEGAYNYQSYTDFYVDADKYNLCHQSRSSYPYLLSKSLSLDWFGSVACSGAQQKDVTSTIFTGSSSDFNYLSQASQAKNSNKSQAFIDAVKASIFPGYIPQSSFINTYTPSVSTITIGGNDIGFGDIVAACVVNKFFRHMQSCNTDRFNREQVANSIDAQIPKLAATLRAIKQKLGGDQKLYVISYPKIMNHTNLLCSLNTPMDQGEREFANNLVEYLNAALKISASEAGARFVDVSDAFVDADHDYRLCGNDVQKAVNGLMIKSRSSRKSGEVVAHESFHPNEFGHSLLAQKIRLLTNDFSLNMPEPVFTSAIPDSSLRVQLVGDNTITDYDQKINYITDVLPNYIIEAGTQVMISISKTFAGLLSQNITATVELHSTPIVIGHITISPDGAAEGTVTIPDSVPVGYHQLHVLYTDSVGQKYDAYKYVLVVASADDYDGDGVKNSDEACLVGDPSGIDIDKDGIDDACDGSYVVGANSVSGDTTHTPTQPVVNGLNVGVNARSITKPQNTLALQASSNSQPQEGNNAAITENNQSEVIQAPTKSKASVSMDSTSKVSTHDSVPLWVFIAEALVALVLIVMISRLVVVKILQRRYYKGKG